MIRAGIWAKNHYDEVMKIPAKATEVPEDAVRRSYAQDLYQHMIPEVSERTIKALEIQKNFMKGHGIINNDFDVGTWVDGNFLEAAKKELEAESHQK